MTSDRVARGLGSMLVAALPDEVDRVHLIERLRTRWVVSIVTLVAPGGFGKSVTLAQAVRDNLRDPVGMDVYIPVQRAQRTGSALAACVLDQLGTSVPPSIANPEDLAGVVAAALTRWAPTPVCLVLDDLHVLDDDDEAVGLLAALVRSLPFNAHLVLAGRRLPRLPLAHRRAADQVASLVEADLAFTDEESALLAHRHGTDAARLDLSAGWPALTRLALVVDHNAPLDYLMDEVIDGLDHPTRRGLAAAVLGRHVDDALLRAVTGAIGASTLVERVPLIATRDGGAVQPHDFWSQALDHLVPAPELADIAIKVCEWHLAAGRHDEALDAAVTTRQWELACHCVVRALEAADPRLQAATTRRWLRSFPNDRHEHPALVLLHGVTERMLGSLDSAHTVVDRALTAYSADDDPRAEAVAALEAGLIGWLRGDIGRVLEMVAVGERLAARGVTTMQWMIDLAYAGFADLQGDPAEALRRVDRIEVTAVPSRVAQLVLRWRCVLPVALGDTAQAVAYAGELLAHDPSEMARLLAATVHWQHGDPEPMRADASDPPAEPTVDNAADAFLTACYQSVIEASLGRSAPTDRLVALATERSRDRALVTIACAASLVAAGDDAAASRRLEELVDAGGLEDPVVRVELRRFVSLCAPLSQRVADALAADALGPTSTLRRDLADLARRARRGDVVGGDDLPPPPFILTGLPLRWSLGLAASAATTSKPAALRLAGYLVDYVGTRAHEVLRELATGPAPASAGAKAILAEIPAEPNTSLAVTCCGPLLVTGTGTALSPLLRRQRVRELLGLLVLRERVAQEQIVEALWPGLDPDDGRTNLRVTLRYARQVLEPGRAKGQPAYHLRREGDELWLTRSPLLQVDLWDIRGSLRQARELESLGRLAEATAVYEEAVRRWTGPVLPDLRDHFSLAPEVTYLDMELERAAAQVAEWHLAHGSEDRAIEVAERLLTHDAFAERAHVVVMAAHLARGEFTRAGEALARCRSALAELGLAAGPGVQLLAQQLAVRRTSRSGDQRP